MPAKVTHNVSVGIKRKNSEKKDYHKIGVIIENDAGHAMLVLNSKPFNWDGTAYLFKNDKAKAEPQRQEPEEATSGSDQSPW